MYTIEQTIAEAVARIVREQLGNLPVAPEAIKVTDRGAKIAGIRGLATHLGVSAATAQKLKNLRKVPYMEVGNRLFFFANEVDNALAVEGGRQWR